MSSSASPSHNSNLNTKKQKSPTIHLVKFSSAFTQLNMPGELIILTDYVLTNQVSKPGEYNQVSKLLSITSSFLGLGTLGYITSPIPNV